MDRNVSPEWELTFHWLPRTLWGPCWRHTSASVVGSFAYGHVSPLGDCIWWVGRGWAYPMGPQPWVSWSTVALVLDVSLLGSPQKWGLKVRVLRPGHLIQAWQPSLYLRAVFLLPSERLTGVSEVTALGSVGPGIPFLSHGPVAGSAVSLSL